jgi:hypothetical protein
MEVNHRPSVSDQGPATSASSAGRHRRLRRLVDLSAAAAAESALQTAAARMSDETGLVSSVLSTSRLAWGGAADLALQAEDTAVHDRLREAVISPEFLSLMPLWVRELREVAATHPESGACTLATSFQLWSWTVNYFRAGQGMHTPGATQALDELAEGICPLLAARCFVLEITGETSATPAKDELRADLCHVYAAHAAATAGTLCAELVFGSRRHLVWDAEGCAVCFRADDLDELEGLMPGIASGARGFGDVIEDDGSHAAKAGPCARIDGVDAFVRLRSRLDGCLTGSRLAKMRAAASLARPFAATDAPTSTAAGDR